MVTMLPNDNNGITPVVGVAVLIAITATLAVLVFVTTGGFMTEQQAPSAGANVNIVSESVIEVQLDSVQNADNVYVESPLGTKYELEKIGDTVEILNIGNKQKPVLIAEKDGKEHVVQGITPRSFDADVVVDKDGSGDSTDIETAINNSSGETVVVKRDTYNTNVDISSSKAHVIGEPGAEIDGDVTISGYEITFSSFNVNGQTEVTGKKAYLASNDFSEAPTTGNGTLYSTAGNTKELIQKEDLTSNATNSIFGSGDDGKIVVDTDKSSNGKTINATKFKINEGVEREFNGVLIVQATKKITINGTLKITGEPAQTGGKYFSGGRGGTGGNQNTCSSDSNEWGSVGDGGGFSPNQVPSETTVDSISAGPPLYEREGWTEIYNSNIGAGAGGGNGGDGGGGGSQNEGGTGGTGGGTVLLVAPDIEITGTIDASGSNGSSGGDAVMDAAGGGGGGGGGAGGLVYLVSSDLTENGHITAARGSGGSGGLGHTDYTCPDNNKGEDGQLGLSGQSGEIHRVSIEG